MSSISIGIDKTVSTPQYITISIEGPIQENEHIWIWDHYFSFVLNHLCDKPESIELINTLNTWSKTFTKNMGFSFEHLLHNDLLQLSRDILITPYLASCSEVFLIESTAQNGYWPNVHIKIDDDATSKNLSYSVIALAQLFLNNNPYFYRDLPLHMLAMQKYYRDELPYKHPESIIQAPAFAFDVASKFYQQLEQTH